MEKMDMEMNLQTTEEQLKGLRLIMILCEIEYCFSNEYSRDVSVVGNEYNSLKESHDWLSICPLKDMVANYDQDLIREKLKAIGDEPYRMSDEDYFRYRGYIETCETASYEDREKAQALLEDLDSITKRYKEDSKEVAKAKEIGEKQFAAMNSDGADSSDIYFMDCDITICNPFMDSTGRFNLTLEQAYKEYGARIVSKFIEDCNK